MDWARLARWHSRFRTAQSVSNAVEGVSTLGYSASDSALAVRDFADNVELGVDWWDLLSSADEYCGEDASDDARSDSGSDQESL